MDLDLKEKIKEYKNRNWNILPVKPNDKRPMLTNWLQYESIRVNDDQITNWFNNLNNVGVGVITGKISNLVVIDVENYCEIPIEELIKKYPTNLISRTGSGGYHLFYIYPNNVDKIKNRVSLFKGIDLRGDGGFIVLPPTIHPNGNRYEWYKQGGMGVFDCKWIEVQKKANNDSNTNWVEELLKGVESGKRNDACTRLAGYFINKNLNKEIIKDLLLEWNKKNNPPLSDYEITRTIDSVYNTHLQNQPKIEFVDDTKVENDQTIQNDFDVMPIGNYIQTYGGNDTNWLIKDWLPDESITFIISPPESFKTWILIDAAISVASGTNFFGNFEVLNKGPTLIIQQEDSHIGLTDRIALEIECKLGCKPIINSDEYVIPTTPNIPIYIHPSRKLKFNNKQVIQELEEVIKKIKPKLILIDPLYSTTDNTDNYMANLANQMMVLKEWRDKYKCSFLIAHHSKKNIDPDSTAREDSWGSQFLNAFLEAGWQIRKNSKLSPNEIIIRRHSKMMGNQEPISVTFDISTVYPLKYDIKIANYEKKESNQKPAKSVIIEELEKGNFNQTELVTRLNKNRSTLSRQLRELENIGAIEKMPDGKYKIVKE